MVVQWRGYGQASLLPTPACYLLPATRYARAAISLPGNRHEQARSESECYLALREGRKLLGNINNALAGLRLARPAGVLAQVLNPSLALFSRKRRSIPDRLAP
jgi:hypothetical protein